MFFCSGVSYLWELRKTGHFFVLIVPEYYKQSMDFQKIANFPEILDILYIPQKGSINIHRFFARELSDTMKEFPPSILLMHSCFFVENLYLLHACRKYMAEVLIYQSARYSIDWDNEWWLILQGRLRSALSKRRLKSRPPFLIKLGFFVSDWGAFVLENVLLPLLFSRTIHTPSINVRNGTIISRKWLEKLGVTYLCYYGPEIEAMHRSLGPFKSIKIRHPAAANIASVMSCLYGHEHTLSKEPTILVVPSWGNIDSLLVDGVNEAEIVSKISDRWIQALELLLIRFPGRSIMYKLHPSSGSDPVLNKITTMIKSHFEEKLVVLQTSAPAERFAIHADVVVGDVSSVLWWSGLIGKKNVISLDIFDYPHGGIMKDYSGLVTVVSDVRDIASIEWAVIQEDDRVPELADIVGTC